MQVLEAMHSVGKRSFGDLKPENVMVVGKKNLTLVDFSSSLDDAQGELLSSKLGLLLPIFRLIPFLPMPFPLQAFACPISI